jgi:hypothetical protein
MGSPHVNQTPRARTAPHATIPPGRVARLPQQANRPKVPSLSPLSPEVLPRRYSHRRRWTAPAAGTPSTGTRSRYAHPPSSSAPRATVPTPCPLSTHAPASACAPVLCVPSSLPGRGPGLGILRGARVCRSSAHAPSPRPRGLCAYPVPVLKVGLVGTLGGLRFDAPLPFLAFEGSEAAEAWPRRQGQHGRLPARGRGGIRPGNHPAVHPFQSESSS